jgi:hypothetical protein
MEKKLKISLLFVFIFNLFDALLTILAVSFFDSTEINPIMNWCLEKHLMFFFCIKIIIMSLIIIKLWYMKEKIVSFRISLLMNLVFFIIVVNNFCVIMSFLV